MTRDQQVELLTRCFKLASIVHRNPVEEGHTPQSYARFVGGEIRRMLTETPERPTIIPKQDALEFADALERGDFESELAGLMGLM
jgi:hypothetical protein